MVSNVSEIDVAAAAPWPRMMKIVPARRLVTEASLAPASIARSRASTPVGGVAASRNLEVPGFMLRMPRNEPAAIPD